MASRMNEIETLALFGGSETWQADEWTDSDDRIRGGSSQSYLSIDSSNNTAHFNGHLDFSTLGGAGFASQRTTGEDWSWDLHQYDGIALKVDVEKSDSKSYTLILKDTLLPPDPETGREQSTISWEYNFTSSDAKSTDNITAAVFTTNNEKSPINTTSSSEKLSLHTLRIPFTSLKPTYRGRPAASSTKALNPYRIKRFSLMSRSHFGSQSGDFSLYVRSIAAYRKPQSRMQALMANKAAMPIAVVVGTAVLWGGMVGVGELIGFVRSRP